MPELRQFANVTQLNENIELSKMQLDDRDAYVSLRDSCMIVRSSGCYMYAHECVLRLPSE